MTRDDERFLRRARKYVNGRRYEQRTHFHLDHAFDVWCNCTGKYYYAEIHDTDHGAAADSYDGVIEKARAIIEERLPLAKLE